MADKPQNWEEVRAIENPTERLVNALDLAIKSPEAMELLAKGGTAYEIIEQALQADKTAANALALCESYEACNQATALHVAARWNATDLTKLLLDHGADSNAIHMEYGTTALIDTLLGYLGGEGAIATANILLDAGADPKRGGIYQNRENITYFSSYKHNTTALHQLIKCQAFTSEVRDNRPPPEDLIPLLDKMIAKGADLDAVCDFSVSEKMGKETQLLMNNGDEKRRGTALDVSEALYPNSPVTAHLRKLTFEHEMHQLHTKMVGLVDAKQVERLGEMAGKLLEAHAYGDEYMQHVLEAMRNAVAAGNPQHFLASALTMPKGWDHHSAI